MSQSESLVEVFEALGIGAVVWVDDVFDPELGDVAAAELLVTLRSSGIVPQHAAFDGATLEDEPSDWIDRWSSTDGEHRVSLANALLAASRAIPMPSGVAEYGATDLNAIIEQFKIPVHKVDLESWRADKAKWLRIASGATLVIVDREFRVGQERLPLGDEIYEEFVNHAGSDAMIAMLTNSTREEGLPELKASLAQKLSLAEDRIVVMSKEAKDGSPVSSLRRAIRRAFTIRTGENLIARVAEAIIRSVAEAQSILRRVSVYDLDLAVFQNSLEEGASEIEVLTRLFQTKGRVHVSSQLASDMASLKAIARLRLLRELEGLDISSTTPSPEVIQWRRDEVFETAELVNGRFAPLALGDVFRARGAPWVLLAQPCDISVRHTGKRKCDEAVLVKIKGLDGPPSDGERFSRFHRFGGQVLTTGRWILSIASLFVLSGLSWLHSMRRDVCGWLSTVSSPSLFCQAGEFGSTVRRSRLRSTRQTSVLPCLVCRTGCPAERRRSETDCGSLSTRASAGCASLTQQRRLVPSQAIELARHSTMISRERHRLRSLLGLRLSPVNETQPGG